MTLHPLDQMNRLQHVVMWALALELQVDRVEQCARSNREEYESDGEVRAARIYRQFTEQHFLLVAGNHLSTALNQARVRQELKVPGLPRQIETALQQLRDLVEHWDRARVGKSNRTLDKLRSAHPDAEPWTPPEETERGLCVSGCLYLPELRAAAEHSRRQAEAAWDAANQELCDDR